MSCHKKPTTAEIKRQAQADADIYPGIAEDIPDHQWDTAKMVKDNVKELNNNPRNSDID